MKIADQRAKKVISDVPYITIATVDVDGNPWNSPVFAAFDDEFNFYWGSHLDSQHSKNIAATEKVFIVIFDSSAASSEGEGVYIKALASEVKDPKEIEQAYDFLKARDANFVNYWQLSDMRGEGPIRMYKAVPQKIWMNDGDKSNGVYADFRKELA